MVLMLIDAIARQLTLLISELAAAAPSSAIWSTSEDARGRREGEKGVW